MLIGLGLGAALGIVTAIQLATSRMARVLVQPMLVFTQALPHAGLRQRLSLIVAGSLLMTATAVPAAIVALPLEQLATAAVLGIAISTIACVLAALTKSAFPGRLVLLIIWYGYFAG